MPIPMTVNLSDSHVVTSQKRLLSLTELNNALFTAKNSDIAPKIGLFLSVFSLISNN